MDIKLLKQLVRKGEGEQLEFKLKANHPEKIVRELVALANTKGGILLLGVSDDGLLKGLKYAEDDEYIMERAIDKYCVPPLSYQLERLLIAPDTYILAYHIATNPTAVHRFLESDGSKKVYYRVGEKSIQASKTLSEILRRKKLNHDVQFRYGELERLFLQLLESNPKVTLAQFANAASISLKQASTLVTFMVLAGVVNIVPDEPEDFFTSKNPIQ